MVQRMMLQSDVNKYCLLIRMGPTIAGIDLHITFNKLPLALYSTLICPLRPISLLLYSLTIVLLTCYYVFSVM